MLLSAIAKKYMVTPVAEGEKGEPVAAGAAAAAAAMLEKEEAVIRRTFNCIA